MTRYRIEYSKTKSLQYTSNLDMQKIWERTLRRSKIPIQYSQGFHPQPKIQLAAPLPLGMTGCAELVDIWTQSDYSPDCVKENIVPVLHTGILIHAVETIPDHEAALQSRLISATYRISIDELDLLTVTEKVSALLSQEHIYRNRRGKSYDLRPLIEEIQLSASISGNGIDLQVRLSARPGATGRPEELLESLGIDRYAARIERLKIFFTSPEKAEAAVQ